MTNQHPIQPSIDWMTGPSADPGFDSQGITVITTNQHPITPSHELLERCRRKFILGKWTVEDIVKISFSEGADAEFYATADWLDDLGDKRVTSGFLHEARRPNPHCTGGIT